VEFRRSGSVGRRGLIVVGGIIAAAVALAWGADAIAVTGGPGPSVVILGEPAHDTSIAHRVSAVVESTTPTHKQSTTTTQLQSGCREFMGKPTCGASWTGVEEEKEKLPCHSEGAQEGEVKLEPITEELGWINKAKGEVGLEERPTNGGLLAKFTCGTSLLNSKTVEIRGGVIGRVTPTNTKVKHPTFLTNEIVAPEGKQQITKFEGGPTVGREIQINGGGFAEDPVTQPVHLDASPATIEIKAKGNKPPRFKITKQLR
jgi:hypothetical protein